MDSSKLLIFLTMVNIIVNAVFSIQIFYVALDYSIHSDKCETNSEFCKR